MALIEGYERCHKTVRELEDIELEAPMEDLNSAAAANRPIEKYAYPQGM